MLALVHSYLVMTAKSGAPSSVCSDLVPGERLSRERMSKTAGLAIVVRGTASVSCECDSKCTSVRLIAVMSGMSATSAGSCGEGVVSVAGVSSSVYGSHKVLSPPAVGNTDYGIGMCATDWSGDSWC